MMRPRFLLAAGAPLLVIAGGAFAATVGISVNSGSYVTDSTPYAHQIGTGESLNIGAANAVSVGMSDTAGIPFAPGYAAWHEGEVQIVVGDPSGQGPVGSAQTTTGSLKYQVAAAAACSWANYWVAEAAAGDTTAANTAATEFERAPSLMSAAITGITAPTGLAPAIDAVKAGDINLVRAMLDVGAVGYANCSPLGPAAVLPAGTSAQQDRAERLAWHQTGMKLLASDPAAAVRISDEVMHGAEMGAAIGQLIQRQNPSLAATLARQAPASGEPLATRVGEQLVIDHPATSAAGTTGQATSGSGIGPVRIGAQLLGMSTEALPQTFPRPGPASKGMREALALGFTVLTIDPLAGPLNTEGISF